MLGKWGWGEVGTFFQPKVTICDCEHKLALSIVTVVAWKADFNKTEYKKDMFPNNLLGLYFQVLIKYALSILHDVVDK